MNKLSWKTALICSHNEIINYGSRINNLYFSHAAEQRQWNVHCNKLNCARQQNKNKTEWNESDINENIQVNMWVGAGSSWLWFCTAWCGPPAGWAVLTSLCGELFTSHWCWSLQISCSKITQNRAKPQNTELAFLMIVGLFWWVCLLNLLVCIVLPPPLASSLLSLPPTRTRVCIPTPLWLVCSWWEAGVACYCGKKKKRRLLWCEEQWWLALG